MRTIFKYILLITLSLSGVSLRAQLLDSLSLDTLTAITSMAEAIKNPDAVVKLELKKQKLSAIPSEIRKFKNLQYLDLSKNKITELPEWIGELTNLQYLILSKNKLVILPKQIGDLAELKYLNANQNELESIPAQMGKLHNLTRLDLWSNNIGSLPEEVKYMKSLRILDLRAILFSDLEQQKIHELLPGTFIYFSPNCKCQLGGG